MNVSANRRRRWIAAAVTAAVAAAVAIAMLSRAPFGAERRAEGAETLGVSPFDLLAASVDEDFPQPPSAHAFEFPADHAAHDDYRTEWWSLSGTLSGGSDAGLPPLGVQWLLMRIGLRAPSAAEVEPAGDTSAWSTSQIYASLFSISSPTGGGLEASGKLSRGAAGLAGASAPPVRVWLESWRLAELERIADEPGLALRLDAEGLELDLELRRAKPTITARDVGGAGAPAAPFQFYTQPRLEARGTLVADGRRIDVDGRFSFEHAWGELPLPGGPVGTDRFTLHLDDGSELILLRTHRRRAGGERTASATGLLIGPDGSASPLGDDDVRLEPVGHWTSPRTGTRYPIRWSLEVPDRDMDLTLRPPMPDQEGEAWLRFWAGPVRVEGTTAGTGFVQLNGYTE